MKILNDVKLLPDMIRNAAMMMLKRDAPLTIVKADSVEEFNRLCLDWDCIPQRIRQVNPFTRFYFMALGIGTRMTIDHEPIDSNTLIYYDLGLDGIKWVKYPLKDDNT